MIVAIRLAVAKTLKKGDIIRDFYTTKYKDYKIVGCTKQPIMIMNETTFEAWVENCNESGCDFSSWYIKAFPRGDFRYFEISMD